MQSPPPTWTTRTRGLPVLLDNGTRSYVWGPPITNLGLVYAVDWTGNVLVYHANGRGGVVAVTDGTKSVAETYITDEFGVPTVRECLSICSGQPFLFAGEPWDDEPNLLYLRTRYDDPGMGRLLTRDSAFGSPASPLTLNRYVYAGNNPTTWVDASGLDEKGDSNSGDDLDDDDDPTTPVEGTGGVPGGGQPSRFGTGPIAQFFGRMIGRVFGGSGSTTTSGPATGPRAPTAPIQWSQLPRPRLIGELRLRADYRKLDDLFVFEGKSAETGAQLRVNDLRSAGGVDRVPAGLTRQTLEMYDELARRQIVEGLDVRTTQALRREIIRILLESGPFG